MVAVKAAKKSDPESQTYTWSGTHSENCSITFLLRVYKDSPSVVEYALNFLAAHKMLESKEGESLVVAGAMVDQAVLHARMPLDAPVVEMGARRVYAVEQLLNDLARANTAEEKKAAQALFCGHDVITVRTTDGYLMKDAMKLSRFMSGKRQCPTLCRSPCATLVFFHATFSFSR